MMLNELDLISEWRFWLDEPGALYPTSFPAIFLLYALAAYGKHTEIHRRDI
jgi:hypothetical protein